MTEIDNIARQAAGNADRLARHTYRLGQLDVLNRISVRLLRLVELAKADDVSADDYRRCILQAFDEEAARIGGGVAADSKAGEPAA